MAVSTTLQDGSSVIAWQSADGVSFQLLDSSGVPIGNAATLSTTQSAWTSVSPLADGGFSIIWSGTAGAAPLAQNYDANGTAVGASYTVPGAAPTAALASTSLELPAGDQNGSGPWTTLLPNGDTVTVTSQDSTGPGAPQLLMQQFDASGHEVGADYVEVFQGLPGLGRVQTTALAGGGYVVTSTDNQNYGGALYYDLFGADGSHLAGQAVAQAGWQLMGQHATAALPDGGFVMSWVAAEYTSPLYTPAPLAIFAEEFRSDGSAASSAQMLGVLPSTDTAPAAPEIVALASGKYTISWSSGGATQSASFTEQGAAETNYTNDAIFTPAATYTLPAGPHTVILVGSGPQTVTGNNLGDTIVSNDTASTLIGGQGNDTLVAGHNANILTGGAGADTFVLQNLPWNASQITDFTSGTDKIDVSGVLKAAEYSGSDPFGDGTLTLSSDGHGGTDLVYHPAGAGANGVWPTTIVDMDNVAPTALNISTDFITGYGSTTGAGTGSGGTTGSGTGSTTGTGTGSGGTTGTGGTGGAGSGTTGAQTLTANDTADQQLTATSPDATFIAGHNSAVMTEDGGTNTFVFSDLPWNAGQITNFNPAQDKIDVSGILHNAGYAGSNPFSDGTLTFNPDGHGGTDLVYNPPGAGSNGIWSTTIVDIDNVAAGSLNTGTDFITGGATSGGGTTTGGTTTGGTTTGSTGSGTSGGTSGSASGSTTPQTLTADDTAGQQLTATTPNATFVAGHNSVVMTEDGGANTFVFNSLPWNAGQITNFNPVSDTLDVSGILQAQGYTGTNPLGDGTLSLSSDGHAGTELIYHPPGAGSNGVWPISVVDLDKVAASQIHASNFLLHH